MSVCVFCQHSHPNYMSVLLYMLHLSKIFNQPTIIEYMYLYGLSVPSILSPTSDTSNLLCLMTDIKTTTTHLSILFSLIRFQAFHLHIINSINKSVKFSWCFTFYFMRITQGAGKDGNCVRKEQAILGGKWTKQHRLTSLN